MSGKHKGSEFEREVAKILSRWWSPSLFNKGELVFWRTHASGKAKHISKHQFGDITNIREEGKPLIDLFVIECKRTKRFNLFSAIAEDKSLPLTSWLKKLKAEAYGSNRFGWLIFKLDRYPIMCAVETVVSKKFVFHHPEMNGYKVLRLYKPYPFDFYRLDRLLKIISPKTIERILEELK